MRKWGVIKIVEFEPECWYKNLVGQKVRIKLLKNGSPDTFSLKGIYNYYKMFPNGKLIYTKHVEIIKI